MRLKKWDYSTTGVYFITIVTHNRVRHFGTITDGNMRCNEAGQLAEKIWHSIPEMFSHVTLDAFVVMPDHLHGILHIHESDSERIAPASVAGRGGVTQASNPMLSDGLPRIIRWFKGRFTHDIRATLPQFSWQSRYHDKIVLSTTQLEAFRKYIHQNPERWKG